MFRVKMFAPSTVMAMGVLTYMSHTRRGLAEAEGWLAGFYGPEAERAPVQVAEHVVRVWCAPVATLLARCADRLGILVPLTQRQTDQLKQKAQRGERLRQQVATYSHMMQALAERR